MNSQWSILLPPGSLEKSFQPLWFSVSLSMESFSTKYKTRNSLINKSTSARSFTKLKEQSTKNTHKLSRPWNQTKKVFILCEIVLNDVKLLFPLSMKVMINWKGKKWCRYRKTYNYCLNVTPNSDTSTAEMSPYHKENLSQSTFNPLNPKSS